MKSNTVPSNSPAMALPAGLSLEVIVALLDMDIPLPGNNHGLISMCLSLASTCCEFLKMRMGERGVIFNTLSVPLLNTNSRLN